MFLTITVLAACLLLPEVEPQNLAITGESSINVTVGDTANFTVKPSAAVRNGNWEFTGKNIGLWIGSSASISNEYQSRAVILTPNGSLVLKSVTSSDSGEYTVTMVPEVGAQASKTITLHVLVPVSNVKVSSNNSAPVESLNAILLTCEAEGSIQSRIWYKGNSLLKDSDGIKISQEKETLIIISADRNDSGTYTCQVIGITNNASGSFDLKINYGPEAVTVEPPGPSHLELGQSITLRCSAQSVPSAAYRWSNGNGLLDSGQTYNIESTKESPGGNYTCEAYNNITKQTKSATIEVTIEEKAIKSETLSAGAIAGIVIAILAVPVIGGTAWFVKKKLSRGKGGSQQKNSKSASSGSGPAASSNGTNPENMKTSGTDVVYSQPNINPLHATAPPELTDSNKTAYAELKFT